MESFSGISHRRISSAQSGGTNMDNWNKSKKWQVSKSSYPITIILYIELKLKRFLAAAGRAKYCHLIDSGKNRNSCDDAASRPRGEINRSGRGQRAEAKQWAVLPISFPKRERGPALLFLTDQAWHDDSGSPFRHHWHSKAPKSVFFFLLSKTTPLEKWQTVLFLSCSFPPFN